MFCDYACEVQAARIKTLLVNFQVIFEIRIYFTWTYYLIEQRRLSFKLLLCNVLTIITFGQMNVFERPNLNH